VTHGIKNRLMAHIRNGVCRRERGDFVQLRLVPSNATGKPTFGAHSKGELYMDSAARLSVCTKGGSPGTWRRFTTTAD
jgi:hypothetical protein